MTTTAPPCPAWCDAHSPDQADWISNGRDVTKLCRHDVEAAHTEDGTPVTVMLDRLAALDQGTIEVDEPTIDLHCPGRLNRTEALRLAEALIHLVTISAPLACQWVA